MERKKVWKVSLGILVVFMGLNLLYLSKCRRKGSIPEIEAQGEERASRGSPDATPTHSTSRKRTIQGPLESRRPVPSISEKNPILVVLDEKGVPVPGAEVSRVDGSKRIDVRERRPMGKTGASGEFSVQEGLLGDHGVLLVMKEGFLPRLVMRADLRKKGRFRVVLEPGLVGVFKFLTPDNFPVPGVKFSISSGSLRPGYCRHGGKSGPCSEKTMIFSGTTGESGELRFACLRRGWCFVDLYKEGFAVQDVRPKPIKLPGGPFVFTLAPLYAIFAKIDGPRFFSSFYRPPEGCRGRRILSFPGLWVKKKIEEGYVCSLFTREYSLSRGWIPVPKKIPVYFLFERLGWKTLDLPVRPFSRGLKPEILKVRVPEGVDRLGYVLVRPKAGKEDLRLIPPRLFRVSPIRLKHPEESPKAGPFRFHVLVKPGKRIGLPEGEYRIFSFVPCVKKVLPRTLRIVSRKGETRTYEIDLKYQLAPVILKFRLPGGSWADSGWVHMEVKGLGKFRASFNPVGPEDVLWLPCTEIQGTYLPFLREFPEKRFSFKVKLPEDGKPVVLEVPLADE